MERTGATEDRDRLLRLLAERRRRYALSSLRNRTGWTAIAEVATEVAARERTRPSGEVPEDAVEHVRTALHHIHLPMLEDAGLVELDDDRERVAATVDHRSEQFIRRVIEGE